MNKKHNVLVFPAGSEIGLEIYNSLKYNHHVEVFGASGKSDHASFVYESERYIEDALYVEQPDFIKRFNMLLHSHAIEFIYPTHDTIANFLAEHQSELAAQVITSCSHTNHIARFKTETYKLFRAFDFCPRLFTAPYEQLTYPVFLKPNDGQGGKGTQLAESKKDLEFYLDKNSQLLVSEFLPGDELSVDCFTDFTGQLRFIGPRTRERIQMGISFRSTAIQTTDEIKHIAESINTTVKLNGAWFFQIKKDSEGKFKLMEFAPRQSSTMGLFRHTGVNFALLSLFNAQNIPITIMKNDYSVQLDRCLHNRFKADVSYQRIYIDYDETLIEGSHVHEQAMAFLFQCRNLGKKIILITKHKFDIKASLKDHGISEYIFEDIIQLTDSQDKSQFIEPEDAIFIDNYWFDRKAVKERHGISVFDADGIECLLR